MDFRRGVSGSGWLLGATITATGFNFVQGIVTARMLGEEYYGMLARITTYTSAINQLVDSRVWETGIRFVLQFKQTRESARANALINFRFLIDAMSGMLAFVMLLATAGWVSISIYREECGNRGPAPILLPYGHHRDTDWNRLGVAANREPLRLACGSECRDSAF